jgi:hypothetical protein
MCSLRRHLMNMQNSRPSTLQYTTMHLVHVCIYKWHGLNKDCETGDGGRNGPKKREIWLVRSKSGFSVLNADYIQNSKSNLNFTVNYIFKALQNDHVLAICRALGIISKIITEPYYERSDRSKKETKNKYRQHYEISNWTDFLCNS